jgi:seryl-tRNA synthetase
MLDPKLLRADLDAVVSQLARKGMTFDRAHYLTLEADRKRLQLESESLANRRKEGSKQIGQLMQAGKIAEADAIKEEMANIGEAISAIDAHFSSTSEALDELLLHLPNLPDASVPDGFREEENVVAATVGSAPDFAFEPKDHVALGELAQRESICGYAGRLRTTAPGAGSIYAGSAFGSPRLPGNNSSVSG